MAKPTVEELDAQIQIVRNNLVYMEKMELSINKRFDKIDKRLNELDGTLTNGINAKIRANRDAIAATIPTVKANEEFRINLRSDLRKAMWIILTPMLVGICLFTWERISMEKQGRLQTPEEKKELVQEQIDKNIESSIKKHLDKYFKDKK